MMRPQLRRCEAKKIEAATITVEANVTAVQTNPKRENVLASGSVDIRHNRSTVSMARTVQDRKIAIFTLLGESIVLCALTQQANRRAEGASG